MSIMLKTCDNFRDNSKKHIGEISVFSKDIQCHRIKDCIG